MCGDEDLVQYKPAKRASAEYYQCDDIAGIPSPGGRTSQTERDQEHREPSRKKECSSKVDLRTEVAQRHLLCQNNTHPLGSPLVIQERSY